MTIKQEILDFYGTQAELARRLDVTAATVSEWFRDEGPRPIPPMRAIQISKQMGGSIDPIAINPKAAKLIEVINQEAA